jgi:hypothetical protein
MYKLPESATKPALIGTIGHRAITLIAMFLVLSIWAIRTSVVSTIHAAGTIRTGGVRPHTHTTRASMLIYSRSPTNSPDTPLVFEGI